MIPGELITDQGDGLGVVELEPARAAPLGQQRGGEDQQLVFFSRGQVHDGAGGKSMVDAVYATLKKPGSIPSAATS